MKKLLSILLVVIMLAGAVPFSMAADDSGNTKLPKPDLAYTSIGNAITLDNTNNTKTQLANTNWSFQHGDSFANLLDYTINKTGPFGTEDFGKWTTMIPSSTPTGYVFNNVVYSYIQNVAVYDTATYSGIVPHSGILPNTGVIFSVSQHYSKMDDDWFSMTYTVPHTGKITLNDPENGKLLSIKTLGKNSENKDCNTLCLNDADRQVYFAIYKNDEKIWPTDSEKIVFKGGKNGNYSIQFPTIESLSVEEGDKIYLTFNGTNLGTGGHYSMAFALNPQVEYKEIATEEEEEPVVHLDSAHTCVGKALASDKADGSAKEYFKLDWSFMHGDTFANLDEYTIEKIGPFGTYRFSGDYARLIPETTPDGYIFNKVIYDVYDENVTVYDSETYTDIVPNKAGTLPKKGIMFSVSQHITRTEDDWFSMTYTAPHGGTLTLSDLDGGMIASIASLGTSADGEDCKTLCVNDGDKKQVKFAIYKNDKKIWPTDSDSVVFKADNYAVKFPKIKNISVEAGDKIHLVFNGTSTSGSYSMAFALNPSISYTHIEPFKVEDQDIIDMINNTTTTNSAKVFKAAIDADAASGQTNYLSAESPWSIQKSTVGYKYGWSELSANYVKNFFVLNLSVSGWPPITGDKFPYGYQYDNIWAGHDWAVYDVNNPDQVSLTGRGNMPEQGMLGYFHKHDAYYALCYKAQKSGTVRLYDPNGTDITTISHIDSKNMNSLDTSQKKLHIAIYKNDEKIWPEDADYYELNSKKGSVEFPDIQGIQMNSDDTLRIIFKNASTNNNGPMLSNMIVALNPQVDFINYFKSTHDATQEIAKAIQTDIENGRDGFAGDTQLSILYSNTYSWRVETKKDGAWSIINPMVVDDLQLTVPDGVKLPQVLPFGSLQLGTYDENHNAVADQEISEKGLLLSVSDMSNPVSLSYVVTDEKYIRIRDILKGNITMIKEICGTKLDKAENIKCAIYHNDQKLWPADDIKLSDGAMALPDISVATEEEDRIRFVFEAENPATAKPFMVVMNPYVAGYSIAANKVVTTEIGALKSHNAYSEIGAALSKDIKAKKPTALAKTNWKMESSTDFGTAKNPTWKTDTLGYEDKKNNIPMTYTQRFTVYNSASAPTSKWPMAYAYNYNKFLGVYDQNNNVKAFNVSRLPQTGVLMTTMGRKVWHSLTWVADKDGEIHLYDPKNGYITAINSIDSVNLRAHDYDANYSKDVEIAIYKNNEKLWPLDTDYFVAKSAGANEEKSTYFPDCVGIEVSKGDAIRVVIHSCGDSDTIPAVIAMNPQIDYTAYDYIRDNKVFADKAPSDEIVLENNNSGANTEDTVIEPVIDQIITDDTEQTDEAPTQDQNVVKRKKKIIKVISQTNTWGTVILIGSIVLAVLIAAGVTVFIIIKRRRTKNGG